MGDGDAMLAAIRADRHDDTVRLAYADWLDEQGGIVCKKCFGQGHLWVADHDNGGGADMQCSRCRGNGYLPNPKAAWIRTQIRAWNFGVTLGVVPKGVLLAELAWARPDGDPYRYDTSGSAGRGDVTIHYPPTGFSSRGGYDHGPVHVFGSSATQVTYSRGFVESITLPLRLLVENEAAVVALTVGVVNLHTRPTPDEKKYIRRVAKEHGIAFRFNGKDVRG